MPVRDVLLRYVILHGPAPPSPELQSSQKYRQREHQGRADTAAQDDAQRGKRDLGLVRLCQRPYLQTLPVVGGHLGGPLVLGHVRGRLVAVHPQVLPRGRHADGVPRFRNEVLQVVSSGGGLEVGQDHRGSGGGDVVRDGEPADQCPVVDLPGHGQVVRVQPLDFQIGDQRRWADVRRMKGEDGVIS